MNQLLAGDSRDLATAGPSTSQKLDRNVTESGTIDFPFTRTLCSNAYIIGGGDVAVGPNPIWIRANLVK